MSPKTRETVERARDSVEKAAYAAVGAPVAAVKSLGARISELRDAVTSSGKELGDDLMAEMDEWISEGEAVIEKAMMRLRSSDSVREARKAAGESLDKTESMISSGLDLIEPDEPLTTINGIGSGYATQLEKAGVSGIASFMAKTATAEDISKLAERTDHSVGTIESWREQVELTRIDGIGGSYQNLLHRVGVWTIRQLADSDPAELVEEMSSIDLPDAPDQMPSVYATRKWVQAAAAMVASS